MKEELLKKAKEALNEKDYASFKKSIKNGNFDFIGISLYSKSIATTAALLSVYNGDCDYIVFDHYRKSKDLHKLVVGYEIHLDEL